MKYTAPAIGPEELYLQDVRRENHALRERQKKINYIEESLYEAMILLPQMPDHLLDTCYKAMKDWRDK